MAEIIIEHPARKDPDAPVVEPQAKAVKAQAKEEPKAAAVEEKKPEAKAKEDDKPQGAMRFGQGRR